jgi:hypothetical protein
MPADRQPPAVPTPTVRSFVSLALVLHLVCIGFVFSANVNPSLLQQRLAGILGPYTQLLHLDPGLAKVQFTDGTPATEDYVIVVVPRMSDGAAAEADQVRLPGSEPRFSPQRWRAAALAREMGAYTPRDELIALFARAIGAQVMQDKGLDHVYVRVLHKASQPLNLAELLPGFPPDDPDAPPYFDQIYEAEVWIDEDGDVQVLKRATGRDAAPTSEGGAA